MSGAAGYCAVIACGGRNQSDIKCTGHDRSGNLWRLVRGARETNIPFVFCSYAVDGNAGVIVEKDISKAGSVAGVIVFRYYRDSCFGRPDY